MCLRKLLVADQPVVEDLEGIDFSLVKSLDLLRTIESKGVDSALFRDTFFETFTTNSSDDRTVELVSHGATIDVTFETRHQYCDLVLQHRLHEFDRQAAAIREGLGTIVPLSLLSLFGWEQLEEMVCGVAEVNVQLLESIAEYSSCSAQDPHVRLFWQAMADFSNEERSALIKFTWGRSRLPLTAAGFTQRFKLQNFDKSPADSYFPVAHTCFFSLELPRYSTIEIMKDKLRYAIFNCEAIDGDDTSTGQAIAAMGWEE
jgi:E3 ubiquitin-protein ligase HERC2